MDKKRHLKRELFKATLLGIAGMSMSGSGLLAYATLVEPQWVEVKHVRLSLPRLHPHFDGYRIVQISDLHTGKWMPTEMLEDVVRRVNAQAPDLVVMTGDFVTYTYHEAPLDIVPSMSKLRAKDGVMAILGNHDYWGNHGDDLIRAVIRDSGMIDLNNSTHTLERDGKPLHFAGVDSARERMARIDVVLKQLPEDGAAILLAHEPDFADVSAPTGRFDLQLSGHSHGGQVVIPFVGPPHLPPLGKKYHTGRYQVGSMIQYTNRGLGVVSIPVRFCCRPEITVITLNSAQA
ncbi:MAG: metallophosphoesterase [Chloroflexota bacterium]